MTNSLIPDPSREVVLGASHRAALEERVLTPARQVGSDLSVLAVTEPLPPVEYQRSPSGDWWVANNFDNDVVAQSNGGLMKAPPEVVATFRDLREAGVDFDAIWILHELPGSWEPGTPAPNMEIAPTGPSPSAPVVAFQEATFSLVKKAVAAATTGAAAVAAATVSAASAAGSVVAFDPVVLGGIKDPDGDLIAWVLLAHWDEVPR